MPKTGENLEPEYKIDNPCRCKIMLLRAKLSLVEVKLGNSSSIFLDNYNIQQYHEYIITRIYHVDDRLYFDTMLFLLRTLRKLFGLIVKYKHSDK